VVSAGARRGVTSALVVLAGVLLVLATVAGYLRLAIVDSEQFANRATATLKDPSVRNLVAERVTDQVVLRSRSDLLAARPLIIGAASGIVGGGAFATLFHRAALDVHRAVFDRDQDTISLTLVDVGTVAGEALRSFRPKLAAQVEGASRISVLRERVGGTATDIARIGDEVRFLALLLGALTVAAAAGALALSRDRRRTASQLGVAAIAAGVVVVVAYFVGRVVVLARFDDPEEHAAAAAVYARFLGDLRNLGFVVAGAGAIIAAAAASLIAPETFEAPVARAWRIATTEPERPWLRALRAVALIAAGAVVVAEPSAALTIAVILAGVVLIQQGAETLLRLVYRPPAPEPEREEEPDRPRRLRTFALGAAAVAVIAGVITVFIAAGGVEQPRAAIRGCNGSESLCDKRLDEVVLPATHNSMSVPLKGWFSAEQERPIAGQLDDGIRGLLLDTHYATKLPNGRFRTEFGGPAELREAVRQDGASDASVQAALRLRDRLGFRGSGERGMYLCHTFCELGATALEPVLEDIHEFLVTHPTEVVVMVNQDYVTPQDFVKAVRDAGLERMALQPPATGEWPTLRELVDADTRLVMLAENQAGAAPWYRLAYARDVEETPYTFPKAAQLLAPAGLAATCVPNRGPERAPMFLLNHWVSTDPAPRPGDAARVNAYGPLLRRAQECARIRDHVPNLLAVNFYRRGDLFRVVDTLNGVHRGG
jgi:hypothetical protein